MARAAEQAGIEAVVCTPHYIDDCFKNSAESNLVVLNSLKRALELNGIRIEVYLGNEIYITPDIITLLDSKKICTLNSTRYILIEMPFHINPLFTDDIIFKLKLRGLVPVIAHPERYEWVRKNPKELSDIISKGCLTQLNIASINGYYGESIRKVARALAKENYIHFLGSDSHTSRKIYNRFKTDLKLLQRISSERAVNKMIENTKAAMHNQAITTLL
jgi:protein-tyrosine phosphatase